MTIHRLTELDFGYVILSGCRPWRHFTKIL